MVSKIVLIFALCLFVFSGCLAHTKSTKPSPKSDLTKSREAKLKLGYVPPPEPDILIYEKHNDWESSFNPHEKFKQWKKLYFDVQKDVYFIAVGNPKHDWNEWDINKDLSLRAVPPGEITSAIIFVFGIENKHPHLRGFEFVDDLGITNIFALDDGAKCYIRIPYPEIQQFV